MRITLDNNGRCTGYGDMANWPYPAPDFINHSNFQNWVCNDLNNILDPASWTESPLLSVMTPEQVVEERINAGERIIRRYLSENATVINIPVEENTAQLTAFLNPIMALRVGDLKTAYGIISGILADTFVLTPQYATKEERKQSYLDELLLKIGELYES